MHRIYADKLPYAIEVELFWGFVLSHETRYCNDDTYYRKLHRNNLQDFLKVGIILSPTF